MSKVDPYTSIKLSNIWGHYLSHTSGGLPLPERFLLYRASDRSSRSRMLETFTRNFLTRRKAVTTAGNQGGSATGTTNLPSPRQLRSPCRNSRLALQATVRIPMS